MISAGHAKIEPSIFFYKIKDCRKSILGQFLFTLPFGEEDGGHLTIGLCEEECQSVGRVSQWQEFCVVLTLRPETVRKFCQTPRNRRQMFLSIFFRQHDFF